MKRLEEITIFDVANQISVYEKPKVFQFEPCVSFLKNLISKFDSDYVIDFIKLLEFLEVSEEKIHETTTCLVEIIIAQLQEGDCLYTESEINKLAEYIAKFSSKSKELSNK